MAESNAQGFPIEILSLVPGECEGEPVAMLMVRAHPEHLRPVTFFLDTQQVLFIRDVLDGFLNNPTCWLYMHEDVQRALAMEEAVPTYDKKGENHDLSVEKLMAKYVSPAEDDLPANDEFAQTGSVSEDADLPNVARLDENGIPEGIDIVGDDDFSEEDYLPEDEDFPSLDDIPPDDILSDAPIPDNISIQEAEGILDEKDLPEDGDL